MSVFATSSPNSNLQHTPYVFRMSRSYIKVIVLGSRSQDRKQEIEQAPKPTQGLLNWKPKQKFSYTRRPCFRSNYERESILDKQVAKCSGPGRTNVLQADAPELHVIIHNHLTMPAACTVIHTTRGLHGHKNYTHPNASPQSLYLSPTIPIQFHFHAHPSIQYFHSIPIRPHKNLFQSTFHPRLYSN